jgi:hypothetical protein
LPAITATSSSLTPRAASSASTRSHSRPPTGQEEAKDKFRPMVCPIVVGRGRHLFEGGGHQRALTLVTTSAFSTGVVQLTYRPTGT